LSPSGTYLASVTDYSFPVIVERDEAGWYVAECPVLDGCYTQGETEEEALELVLDVIRLHVEDLLARGFSIPQAVGVSTVRIAV
jgi:predicted RNase H-like HicB family nuclease